MNLEFRIGKTAKSDRFVIKVRKEDDRIFKGYYPCMFETRYQARKFIKELKENLENITIHILKKNIFFITYTTVTE